jgi:hypothetical protein
MDDEILDEILKGARESGALEIKAEPAKPAESIASGQESIFNGARDEYVQVYNSYKGAFGKFKQKGKSTAFIFEKSLEDAKKMFVLAEDARKLKSEKEEERREAEERQCNFVDKLIMEGMGQTQAEALYNVELKKAEYGKAKINFGRELYRRGIKPEEIFKKLVIDDEEFLSAVRIESWPPNEKKRAQKIMKWRLGKKTDVLETKNAEEFKLQDDFWNLAQKKLEQKGYLAQLSGSPEEALAKKIYLIDFVKDKIIESQGQINIDSMLENKDIWTQAVKSAENLTAHEFGEIIKNNATIGEWMKNNPGRTLTVEKMEEILQSSVSTQEIRPWEETAHDLAIKNAR